MRLPTTLMTPGEMKTQEKHTLAPNLMVLVKKTMMESVWLPKTAINRNR
jgi:hypothetical protein